MPTAAKLIAALIIGGFAWGAGRFYVGHNPEGLVLYGLPEKNALVGAVCGWWILGTEVGHGYARAISGGVRAMLGGVFWSLLINGIVIMFDRAFARVYRTMIDAIEGVFGLIVQYGKTALETDVAGTLILGAVVGGICAEWVARRWS